MPTGIEHRFSPPRRVIGVALVLALMMTASGVAAKTAAGVPAEQLELLNRITWGANLSSSKDLQTLGVDRWLEAQIRADPNPPLPAAAQAQIDSMRLVREPMVALVVEESAQNKAAEAFPTPDQRKAARLAFNQAMDELDREAATRSILRALYSPAQLREQMTWFWFNQFNVQASKRDIRAMVGDYEDQAIRPHALGKFRDLLEATLRHPAMLRYLDNDQNAVGHINENYAREIMELHTMGVGAGYTQKDVQELARILTGVGISLPPDTPKLKAQWQPLYVRSGLFEFNPARHDFGDKVFLGHTIKGSGYAEVEQALDLIAASPATAHHVSERIAVYFTGDNPDPALVDRMTATFLRSDGDIPAVLRVLFRSSQFRASLGQTFKDPMHYAISSVRLAYDDCVILNTAPILGWLYRMGQSPYAHETPDGYPLEIAAWTGPGQMAVRFEIARQIGGGSTGLFTPLAPGAAAQPTFPNIQNALFYGGLQQTLATPTKIALDQAGSPADWNALFLSSPDFMRR